MASVLSSFFSRDPKSQFAYDIPAQSEIDLGGVKLGPSFKKAEPDELATVFWSSVDAGTLRLQAQKLKTMRHPNILTYNDSIDIDNNFYLVTEKCTPLSHYFNSHEFNAEQKEFVVSWGLFQLLNCLKFLHEANLSHENIREGIFVTAGGDWKLSSLHMVSSFNNAQKDLNQLALVIWEIFNGFNAGMSKAAAPAKIPKRLVDLYKKLASPSASKLSCSDLIREHRLTGGYLKNKYVDTLLFLEEFQLKEANEKQIFFMHLRESLDIFPDDIAKYKILPKLVQSYEYGDAGPNILIPLFKLGRLLAEEEYQRKIVPCLVKLFSSSDRTTRVKLLERIEEFSPHLTPQLVNDKIFGNLVSGFMDTSPAVRESTVKAMVPLAEKLNSHNLNVELMKYLARLQGADDHGGIRTNTTICLGKIGGLLDPSKRPNILIGAFTRGMKDPFPPARLSALLALSATQQFYTIVDIANRILPSLTPLCCDPEAQVREQAFKAIKGFLGTLEKASEDPSCIPELEAQVKAGGKSLLSADKVPQWASWALKSLSGKFYKGPVPPDPKKAPTEGEEAKKTPPPAASAVVAGKQRVEEKVSDGWDDMDDDEFADADDWSEPAKKTTTAADEDDDWSSGWETAPKKVTPKTSTASSKSSVPSRAIKPEPVVASSKASGWDDESNGWGDNSGWEEDSKPSAIIKPVVSSISADKEAKRLEAQARADARKKELAEKRAARGAMKLKPSVKAEPKLDDFSDW